MSLLKEFKEFAVKGNALDLAVGVIIGGAFGKIVDSVVKDLIMPLVSGIFGSPDFSNLYLALAAIPEGVENNLAGLQGAGVPVFAYGNFLTVLINFIILAFVIFLMVKQINKLRRRHEEQAAPEPEPAVVEPAPEAADITLLREIRDLLNKQ